MSQSYSNAKPLEPITVESLERTVDALRQEYPEQFEEWQYIPIEYLPFWRLLAVLRVKASPARKLYQIMHQTGIQHAPGGR